jgi:hypothetical protein
MFQVAFTDDPEGRDHLVEGQGDVDVVGLPAQALSQAGQHLASAQALKVVGGIGIGEARRSRHGDSVSAVPRGGHDGGLQFEELT